METCVKKANASKNNGFSEQSQKMLFDRYQADSKLNSQRDLQRVY